jgi:ABC-2 type transport system ATP-binding protein
MELVIDKLSKTYPNGVQALKAVSFTIPTGLFGLLGPNGAGKSTLMRTIATLQDPDSGSIHFGMIDILKDQTAVRNSVIFPRNSEYIPKSVPGACSITSHS